MPSHFWPSLILAVLALDLAAWPHGYLERSALMSVRILPVLLALALPLLAAAWLWGAFRLLWGESVATLPPMLCGAVLFVYLGRYVRRGLPNA